MSCLQGDYVKIAVLISGRGTNLEALLKAEKDNRLGTAKISLVISNNPKALGLEVANNYNTKTVVIKSDKQNFEHNILEILEKYKIELIVLAGFMKILSSEFVKCYRNKIINIHPSLLPAFPGLKAQKQALEYGVKISGCTVHFVNEEIDNGPIILQKQVLVEDDDTEELLSERILKEEHNLLPEAVKLYSLGKIRVNGRQVRIVE